MTEWTVFLLIGEVVGLFLLVGVPIIRLNATIVALVEQLKTLKTDYRDFSRKSEEIHEGFRSHLSRHDTELQNHEFRLSRLEEK